MSEEAGSVPQPNGSTTARAVTLRRLFEQLGCHDGVEAWVQSELSENIPQLARYRFLSMLWPTMINSWRQGIDNVPATARILAAGADRADLVQLARAVAYETVFGMLYHLDDDGRDDDGLPFWELKEIDPSGQPTGRTISAIFEDLLTMDPSGLEGSDFLRPLPGS